MADTVQMAFDPKGKMVPITRILPVRTVRPETRRGQQYLRLFASIRELGVIEPLMVYPQESPGGTERRYTLLDGHFRLDVLKELGRTEAFCLIANDDEAFTYNHKINRMAPIQEHFMILRALENGVTEERIAATLSVDVKAIRIKRDLLAGICPEAVALLKDRKITANGLREIKRAVSMRQIEMAELMVAANNFSTDYAMCLIAATPKKDLVETDKNKVLPGMKPEDIARMEREMELLGRDFLMIEESHGKNTLNLVLAVAYLRKLLDNANVVKYLLQRYPDILSEFQKLDEAPDFKGGA
jgi:hypothetical protein